jgi:hypothetical protein
MIKKFAMCMLPLVCNFAWASNTDVTLNLAAGAKAVPFIFDHASSVSISSGTAGMLEKITVHVNPTAPGSALRGDTLVFHCNGTIFKIKAGDTVVCQRDASSFSYLELTREDWDNGSEGAISVKN